MLRARSAELRSKQTKQSKRKMSVDRQTLCAPLLDLIRSYRQKWKPPMKMQNEFWLCYVLVVWKIVEIMTLYHVRTENKNIYCDDGVPPNVLAVMRCLLNFLWCLESPKVPLNTVFYINISILC